MKIVPPRVRRAIERTVIPCALPADEVLCPGSMRIDHMYIEKGEWWIDWVCPVCTIHHLMGEKWMSKTYRTAPNRIRILKPNQVRNDE